LAQGLTVVADSSAWISFYRSEDSIAKQSLANVIVDHTLLVPDLVLAEVIRGIGSETRANEIIREFEFYDIVELGGKTRALQAAQHYRHLRAKGITVRGTVDLLIATWCIENDIPLLHADRDFAGFEEHLGLKRWSQPA
jgi:predicted nucleic acid-binding protein